MNEIHFKIGDRVAWVSNSQGIRSSKIGTVIEIVTPGCMPTKHGHGVLLGRKRTSYVIGYALVER